ncbi:hypothetical protein [Verminephrobacter aporrectodeae]|uniref:hypothetical protein n=1 Tax=Verminephrobacter aporrectodeae TaxID=1110389 RepID=UPI0022370FB1|nr:hypothetical protein [Verminephrobacter aporrectodeae]
MLRNEYQTNEIKRNVMLAVQQFNHLRAIGRNVALDYWPRTGCVTLRCTQTAEFKNWGRGALPEMYPACVSISETGAITRN